MVKGSKCFSLFREAEAVIVMLLSSQIGLVESIDSKEMWPFVDAMTNNAANTYQEVIIPVARHDGGCSGTLGDAKLRELGRVGWESLRVAAKSKTSASRSLGGNGESSFTSLLMARGRGGSVEGVQVGRQADRVQRCVVLVQGFFDGLVLRSEAA